MLSSTELTLTLINMEYDDKLDFTDSGEFKRLSRQATNQVRKLDDFSTGVSKYHNFTV